MDTKIDIKEWVELQNKDYKIKLNQSDLRMIEMSLTVSIFVELGDNKKNIDKKMETVGIYRALRDKIQAHIID